MAVELIEKYFELTDIQKEQFEKLTPIYSDWNQKINVISRKDMDDFMEKHVLHALAIARYIHFKKDWYVVDLGTGGGFPGIPLAILFPEVKFILVDSIAKKVTVVQAVIEALGLKNTRAICGRVEELPIRANLVVTRAVAPLDKLVLWSKKVLKPQSKGIIALKGGDLNDELHGFKKHTNLIAINSFFQEPFFETKYIVHYKPS